MQTRALYYEDCHRAAFTARVLSCREEKGLYRVILDQTAFYPEGGGQAGDTGTIAGIPVVDTREIDGEPVHICKAPLEPGKCVEGVIDYEKRFLRMQQHTGEHIVSGIIHRFYGFHNTGFHMSSTDITIDFDGVIPPQELPRIEAEANRAVWSNLAVSCTIPDPEALEQIRYRTKRALPWPVRIVEVPGFDRCACCGVHCASTGEVGLVKLFSSIPFRGGSRLVMSCGANALALLNQAWQQNKLVSQAFSAKPEETGEAAQRANEQIAALKFRITALEHQIFDAVALGYSGKGNLLHFDRDLNGTGLRELAGRIAALCGGTAAVLTGSDEAGYSFCLADKTSDLRPLGKALTAALQGKGGGKPDFQQGSVKATREQIEAFFREQGFRV